MPVGHGSCRYKLLIMTAVSRYGLFATYLTACLELCDTGYVFAGQLRADAAVGAAAVANRGLLPQVKSTCNLQLPPHPKACLLDGTPKAGQHLAPLTNMATWATTAPVSTNDNMMTT